MQKAARRKPAPSIRKEPRGTRARRTRALHRTALGTDCERSVSRREHPLSSDGTQHKASGKAYILVPDLTLTVGLFTDPSPSGPIGTVTGSQWQGMRHHDIANVRGLFYEQDRTLGLWEVDAWGRLDEFTHGRLWLAFESFLVRRGSSLTTLSQERTQSRTASSWRVWGIVTFPAVSASGKRRCRCEVDPTLPSKRSFDLPRAYDQSRRLPGKCADL
jgi:hypothetical protein